MTQIRPAKSAPQRVVLEGRYVRLEPMAIGHAETMFAAVSGPGAEARHRWLPLYPPADVEELRAWIATAAASPDSLYFAVIDRTTGRCGGRHALMRQRPEHGSVEIGGVLWGEGIARTRLATEAFYLTARYIFDDLGYRRFEWKCNNRNEPSKAAARRFGFQYEGLFRQDMIVKGENRDTAWFSILDGEWPRLRAEYERWLDPQNFVEDGAQKTRLDTSR
ncbi:GCN5 family acetyltransferase [Devosia geojensis]|uniref:GCN5 family acetyltransferase n=1 Tax=Devosia geojensis TaxID=443610 RepID=A0A0F5FDX0_9HYPH|nr:GNAT family protein [Devosia geojensis]KKB07031.1 GCN5 family acetyltransferase [Devosia geojensis]